MNRRILLWLVKNGFRVDKIGTTYIACGIEMVKDNPYISACEIYKKIAGNSKKSIKHIEKAIRYSIQNDWEKTTFVKYCEKPKSYEVIVLLELLYSVKGDKNE